MRERENRGKESGKERVRKQERRTGDRGKDRICREEVIKERKIIARAWEVDVGGRKRGIIVIVIFILISSSSASLSV